MKRLLATVFLLHFAFFGYAMESIYSVPSDVLLLILSNLSWSDQYNISLTSMRLRALVQAYNEKQSALRKITSFTKPKSTPIVFCCSRKTVCILQEDGSNKLGFRTHIKMFDGITLEERNTTFDLSLANNQFLPCEGGICYTQGSIISLLFIDSDQISSKKLWLSRDKISKIFFVNNNIVFSCYPDGVKDVEIVSLFDINENIQRINYFSEGVMHASGIGKYVILFGVKYNHCFRVNYYYKIWPLGEDKGLWKFPVVACTNTDNLMVTCHIDQESSVKYFSKTILLNGEPFSMIMKLKLPMPILKLKLFLHGNNLWVIGNVDNDNWLLLGYSVDDEKIIFFRNYQGNPAEAYLVENNIFIVFKNGCDEEDMENFEIKVITIDQRLH
jgi:hypothetical protein